MEPQEAFPIFFQKFKEHFSGFLQEFLMEFPQILLKFLRKSIMEFLQLFLESKSSRSLLRILFESVW